MSAPLRPALRFAAGLFAALALVLVFGCDEALAQNVAKNMETVQKSIGNQAAILPRFVGYLAYIVGTALIIIGLIKLKDWLGDSDRNTLNAAIFRLIVGALLIYLPYGIVVANNMLFGGNTLTNVPPPKMAVFGK